MFEKLSRFANNRTRYVKLTATYLRISFNLLCDLYKRDMNKSIYTCCMFKC